MECMDITHTYVSSDDKQRAVFGLMAAHNIIGRRKGYMER